MPKLTKKDRAAASKLKQPKRLAIMRDIREARSVARKPSQKDADRRAKTLAITKEIIEVSKEVENDRVVLRAKHDDAVKALMEKFQRDMKLLRQRSTKAAIKEEATWRVESRMNKRAIDADARARTEAQG